MMFRFVDIDGIVCYHWFKFLFEIYIHIAYIILNCLSILIILTIELKKDILSKSKVFVKFCDVF